METRAYVIGELHITQKPDGWYVEYTDGVTLHSVGPTTKAKAKQIAREAREMIDGPVN